MDKTVPTGPAGKPSWERVKEVFAGALEVGEADRGAFLDGACAGDIALRREVDSLLSEATGGTEFLAAPAASVLQAPAPEVGAEIGGFKLRSIIGEGGMGRVFEASQERPHRTVALKVLRPDFFGPEAERRFHWEVEALGRLSHPAIAAVHEAGVDHDAAGNAISWFAMERIDGQPLLAAADAMQLNRRARLVLFLKIADAIAHAHQRGVIHRDLKPDNILVDARGNPHVLDFGIARTADPLATSVTSKGEILGTIAYMSPEQILGEPDRVDARSDVYALGVLLYKLLTGKAPLDLRGLSLPRVARKLVEEDPTPARDHDTELRGDLDTILSVALERNVERRYQSVDALAADVRRTLDDEPISARPPTALYQLSKFARRNRGLVAGLSLALLMLVGGLVGTTVGLLRAAEARDAARDEQRRAEIERDRAHDANSFLQNLFAAARPDVVGRDVRVVDLLDVASANLESDGPMDAAVSAGLNLTIGDTYRRLGAQPDARVRLEAAVVSFTEADGQDADGTIESMGALVEVLLDLGEWEAAESLLAKLRAAVDARTEGEQANGREVPDWMRLRPLELEGARASAVGDLDGAVAKTRAAFEAWFALHGAGDNRVETARTLYSNALFANGDYGAAKVLLTEGIAALTTLRGPDDESVLTQRSNLMLALLNEGARLEAVTLAEELLPDALLVWGSEHPKTLALRSNTASALHDIGRTAEALVIMEAQVAVTERVFGDGHEETLTARNNASVMLMELDRFGDAYELLMRNVDALEGERGEQNPVALLQTEMNLGPALEGLGRREESLEVQRRVLATFEELFGEAHPQTLIARNNFAMLLLGFERFDEALEAANRNLELAEEAQPGHRSNVFPFRSNRARVLAAKGEYANATAELEDVFGRLRGDADATDAERSRVRELLIEAYEAWGKPAEANALRGDS